MNLDTTDRHVLVIGGQRSGKSRFAEQLVLNSGFSPVYLATATAGDGEMADRINRHRARRGPNWRNVEEPIALAEAVAREAQAGRAVLVDCLTLWLSNLMAAERDVDASVVELIGSLDRVDAPVVMVGNEVGSGIIPDNRLARDYADALGTMHQRIAASVCRVVLVAAGQPLLIKPNPQGEIAL